MDGQAAPDRRDEEERVDDDPLALTIGSIYAAAAPTPPPPAPPRPTRRRRRGNGPDGSKRRDRDRDPDADEEARPPPFPWATERPARHDTLESLLRRGVTSVEGAARCKRCGARKSIAYDLESKFRDLRAFVDANRHAMDDRAPDAWMCPVLPDCDGCGHERTVWPEIAAEKSRINWLFLFLGQMLGCCTLDQLKYFCKNTGRHRTGAKNRVLYYAYIEMCNQLEPFDADVPEARDG